MSRCDERLKARVEESTCLTYTGPVARQNKLEIPRDKDEVNKREIHEYDGRTYDPDTMVSPLTPKPTHTVEVLTRVPPTIASCREEDTVLRKWPLTRYCCARQFSKSQSLAFLLRATLS